MPENYEQYITKNIKAHYMRRLIAPIVYLAVLFAVWIIFPLPELLRPVKLEDTATLETTFREDIEYVRVTLSDLKFTGYTQSVLGGTTGYYYYTMRGDECIIVLLSPSTSEQGLPLIEEAAITGKISHGQKGFDALLTNLSADLNWTENGIRNEVSGYFLSEPDYNPITNFFLFLLLFASGGYALVCLICFIVFIKFPVFSPPCQSLALFGKPAEMLAQAEEELATLPQLATEDMFITEHFFIATSVYGTAILPIDEIIWIYKYSTLHKIFWYHFSISYTLHISANRHLHIQCPKNIKSDLDGIIDYLSEANHNILVGFSEENRLKVHDIQGKPVNFEKLIKFFNPRI